MKKKIRYCPDRKCDKVGEIFDHKTPLCFNENSDGTTYCSTQLEIFGCPKGFSSKWEQGLCPFDGLPRKHNYRCRT